MHISNGSLHIAVGSIALFIGGAQFWIRWLWGSHLKTRDRQSIRAWATSTMVTAFVIAYVMFQFRSAPIDTYFYLVVGVVVAKSIATVFCYRSLLSWMEGEYNGESHSVPHLSMPYDAAASSSADRAT